MELKSLVVAVALGMLIAGCGGGAGGSSSNATRPAGDTPTTVPVVAGVATFSGNRGDYTIAPASTSTSSGYALTNRSSNQLSSVVGAEFLRFADMTVNLGIANKTAVLGQYRTRELIELYMAFYNRVPDANTLATWTDRMLGGQTPAQVAESMYAEAVQAQGETGYGATMITTEFVQTVYKQVFGLVGASAPSAADVEAWSNRIGKGGISRPAMVLAMIEEARGASGSSALATPSIVALLDNRISTGEYFAVQHGLNYNTPAESLVKTKEILAAVTATDFSVARGIIGFTDAAFNLRQGSAK